MKTAITASAPLSQAPIRGVIRSATGARRIFTFPSPGMRGAQRLITQMYFEGDPLIKQCPIVKTINNDEAVRTLIAELDTHAAVPLDCLAYRFDLVLRGHRATLFENRTQGAAR
ncbi:Protocatechuate 3,4-dioxygenase beta chain [Raoultella ornithinolytica]|nr:Protocatechuate 3,4-dioxygenase beta chain [Raoultella ornithinolytica]